MDVALRALNRFGLGARPGEKAHISDAREWLRRQLEGGEARMRAPDGASPEAIGAALRGVRMAGDEAARREARRRVVSINLAESRAALQERLTSERPFVERLVAFWSNHLCVSAASKLPVAALAGAYERNVIRQHVFGRFEDMVLAAARHPAMLLYLDNAQSIGPNSPAPALAGAARGGNGQRGLNENYARELLELHTLGVDGGYTQQDVTELARVLTGWSVAGLQPERPRARPGTRAGMRNRPLQQRDAGGGPIRFTFDDRLHEPGARTVLGVRYDEGGLDQGERVIRALCRHPSTARFVATKLVTHFVADEAPAAAVDHVARAFSETGGDLHAVAMSLIDRPEAWQPDLLKFRTPQDWLVAMLRAVNAPQAGDAVAQVLRQLRQPLWSPQSPKGFGDTTVEWADPDSLLNRAEFARTVSRRFMGRNVDARTLLETIDVASDDPIHTMLAGNATTAADRVALVFAGPSFQWR